MRRTPETPSSESSNDLRRSLKAQEEAAGRHEYASCTDPITRRHVARMFPIKGDSEDCQADHDEHDAKAVEQSSAVLAESFIEGSLIQPDEPPHGLSDLRCRCCRHR